MTNTTNSAPSSRQIASVIGFIGLLVFLAFAAVTIVRLIPSTVSSLASLAEGVNQYQDSKVETTTATPTITSLSTDSSLIESGETVTLTLTAENAQDAVVALSHDCIPGVDVKISNALTGETIPCDTMQEVSASDPIELAVATTENRYTDVTYRVTVLDTDNTPVTTALGQLTVFSPAVEAAVIENTETQVAAIEESPTVTEAPSNPVVVAVAQPVVPTVDLSAAYVGSGNIVDNVYSPGLVKNTDGGAFQFTVLNLGTVTSDSWNYQVALPNGETYTSPTQEPLRSGERAILAMTFPGTSASSHTFVVTVATNDDTDTSNNQFAHTVSFSQ